MYCKAEDVIERYGEKVGAWLKSIAGEEAQAENKKALDLACSDASAEIDGYLTLSRVNLPLKTVPPYITGYACDIAAYLLMMRAGLLSSSEENGENEIVQRGKNARTFFEKWAQGEFDRGDKSGIPNAQKKRVRVSSPKKLDLGGY